jgi:hypothetical protein
LSNQPPILYVIPTDLHEKWGTKQIKVKLPDGTNFLMFTFGIWNNEEYLVHVIAVMRLIKQTGMAQDVKKAFEVLVEVRRDYSHSSRPQTTRQRLRRRSARRSL